MISEDDDAADAPRRRHSVTSDTRDGDDVVDDDDDNDNNADARVRTKTTHTKFSRCVRQPRCGAVRGGDDVDDDVVRVARVAVPAGKLVCA